MSIKSLADARDAGMRVTARWAWGRRDGMKSVRECTNRYELDLDTLIWTRGAQFPLSDLPTRLKCPAADHVESRRCSTSPENRTRGEHDPATTCQSNVSGRRVGCAS